MQAFTAAQDEVVTGRGEGLLGAAIVLHKKDAAQRYIEAHTYTPTAEWLDVVQVWITPDKSGSSVRIRSWSSGFLPTIIPLAPLLNMAFFWFPFQGRDKVGWTNSRRVKEVLDRTTRVLGGASV